MINYQLGKSEPKGNVLSVEDLTIELLAQVTQIATLERIHLVVVYRLDFSGKLLSHQKLRSRKLMQLYQMIQKMITIQKTTEIMMMQLINPKLVKTLMKMSSKVIKLTKLTKLSLTSRPKTTKLKKPERLKLVLET